MELATTRILNLSDLQLLIVFLFLNVIRNSYATTCSGDSCGWYTRKFVKVDNARSHEYINNELHEATNKVAKRYICYIFRP